MQAAVAKKATITTAATAATTTITRFRGKGGAKSPLRPLSGLAPLDKLNLFIPPVKARVVRALLLWEILITPVLPAAQVVAGNAGGTIRFERRRVSKAATAAFPEISIASISPQPRVRCGFLYMQFVWDQSQRLPVPPLCPISRSRPHDLCVPGTHTHTRGGNLLLGEGTAWGPSPD